MKIPNLKFHDGSKVPQIGLGTWELTGRKCEEAVSEALELGYSHIDTAEMYGNHKEIGKAIRGHERDDLFITSKVWHWNLKEKDVIKSAERAIAELGCAYLDLLLIHWPNRGVALESTLLGFSKLIEEGKVLHFGVSNHTQRHIEDVLKDGRVKIAAQQVECHPLFRQEEMRAYCKKKNILFECYSPLGRGRALGNDAIAKIAKKHDKTASQIAIRWEVQNKLLPLPKASTREHLLENIDVFDFKLDKEDLKGIETIKQGRIIDPPILGDFNYK